MSPQAMQLIGGSLVAIGRHRSPLLAQVMKLIEENRRKNEAKRAAQSARNAEITAAFEARMGQ